MSFIENAFRNVNFGDVRQRQTANKVNAFIGDDDVSGALKYAIDRGDAGQVKSLRELAKEMDKKERDKVAKQYQAFGAIALSAKRLRPEMRMGFIQTQLQQAGHDPEYASRLSGTDDATLTAFAQSALSVKDQMAQFTTEFDTQGDQTILRTTDNFSQTGQATNAFTRQPTYAEQTTRARR